MSFEPINFHSYSEIKKIKETERKEREQILYQVKEKYEKRLNREKEAEKRGEKTWMLPSVEDKIKSHHSHKKRKKKKLKKEKAKKHKKDRKSSSDSDSSNEKNIEVWVEKPSMSENQPAKREEWMELTTLFKTQTREQMKIADGSSRALKKLEERKKKEEENKSGSHSRELNPYYKDGGSGLPSTRPLPTSAENKQVSTYEAAWLRKALHRAKNQAEEEGLSLEEIAKERWGSLETFYKLLEDAEGSGKATQAPEKIDKINISQRSRSPNKNTRSRDGKSISGERRKSSRDRSRNRNRSSDRNRSKDRKYRNRDTQSRSRDKKSRSIERSRSRSRDKKSKSIERRNRSRSTNSRSRSQDRNYKSRSRDKLSNNKNKSNASKDRESKIRGSRSSSRGRSNSREKKRTRKSSSSSSSSTSRSSSEDRFKKNGAKSSQNTSSGLTMLKPSSDDELTAVSSKFYTNSASSTSSWKKKNLSNQKIPVPSAPDSTSSSSESESNPAAEQADVSKNSPQQRKEEETSESVTLLTDKEMNQLAAKLTKAELLGNECLARKLKSKLEAARTARENKPQDIAEDERKTEEVVILTRTNKAGFTRPVSVSAKDEESGKRKKKKANVYDADGKRTSYYADDFRVDLQAMFEKEKTTSAADQIADLERLSCANTEKLSDDFDVDDMFISKVAPREGGEREQERERQKAIWEHKLMQQTLDSCHFCVGNKLMKKHLIVALGTTSYVSVPYHSSLTEGHCLIASLHHVPCGTAADEDLWAEIMGLRQALVRMFSANDEDCIFLESAKNLNRTPHMLIHCIPLPKDIGELAPIYFKKAIMESDEEWAQNKKLIDLKGRSARKAIPKGLSYFSVDFGMTPGFAHVIENEALFPSNFGQEIIAGMIDADHSLYRKPKPENFDTQRRKVLKFAEMFKPFDPTL